VNLVLDSSALIALLQKEEGGSLVAEVMSDSTCECYAHAVNLCEVYYDILRSDGELRADAVLADFADVGLLAREDMDRDFWREAGHLKANLRRISLADCFCAALANKMGGEVVTADHHEFDALAANGTCRVRFIR
jgi:PIN domain nuclease of toxin-antitoxin system